MFNRRQIEAQAVDRHMGREARGALHKDCGWARRSYRSGSEDGAELGRLLDDAFECIDALEQRIKKLEGQPEG